MDSLIMRLTVSCHTCILLLYIENLSSCNKTLLKENQGNKDQLHPFLNLQKIFRSGQSTKLKSGMQACYVNVLNVF